MMQKGGPTVNRSHRRWLLLLLPLGLAALLALGAWSFRTQTVDVSDPDALIACIMEREGLAQRPELRKTAELGGFFAVYYAEEAGQGLALFQRAHGTRYEWFAGTRTTQALNTFSLRIEDTHCLAFYGDNTGARAYAYRIPSASGRFLGAEDLGDYVLDLYIFSDSQWSGSAAFLYDEAGGELGLAG